MLGEEERLDLATAQWGVWRPSGLSIKKKKARTVSGKDEKKKKTGTLKILALPTEIDNQWPTG